MEDFSRSSFIPKEASGATPSRVRRRRTFHVLGFIATTMLIGSLALSGGVYFLKISAEKNLKSAKDSLNNQKSLFKSESISEVREFDRRLQAAELLLVNHISPLKIFAALEKDTLHRVQFTNFSIEHNPTFEVLVNLEGTTPEFKSLALQEIQFSLSPILRNVTFSQLATSDTAAANTDSKPTSLGVTFSLKGSLAPSAISYDGTTPSSPQQVSSDESIFNSAVLGESITVE